MNVHFAPTKSRPRASALTGRTATTTSSLEEPDVVAGAARAVVARGHPGVVVVDHAVLFAPPVEGRHEEDEAEHPPDDGHLQAVELAHALDCGLGALRPALLEA